MRENNKKIYGLIALSLIMFMVTLDTTITNIALPNITSFFNSNVANTNWISTIYVLVMSVVIIPASKFGDQFGRKKTMAIGLIVFGIGSFTCGLSVNLSMLIFMRFIQGIGGAIVTPIMIPLSVDLFGREKANQVVGIIGAVTAVAAAAGPPIGGLLLKFLNWHWIFLVNIPVVVITFVLLSVCFQESIDPTISKKIDLAGLIFLTLALSQLTFLLVKGYDLGWSSHYSLLLMCGSISSIIIFLLIEKGVQYPLVELDLFKEATFSASTIIYFMCGFAVVCSSLIFNFYLENIRGYTALNASYIIMFMSITVMISMPIGARLAEVFGYRIVITIGMVLMSISLLLLTTLVPSTTKQSMIIYMIVLGIGFGFACLSIVSAVQFIPESKAGIASGIVNAARQLGTCLGIAILVGTMTHNINLEKESIRRESIQQVITKKLPDDISFYINKKIVKNINSKTVNNNSNDSLKRNLDKLVMQETTAEIPQDSSLLKIHKGLSELQKQFENDPQTISDLAQQVTYAQREMNRTSASYLYRLVKDNPNALITLSKYQQTLVEITKNPESTEKKTKTRQLLTLIDIYQAGTSSEVHNAVDFEKKLTALMTANGLVSQQKLSQSQEELATALSENGKVNDSLADINLSISKIDIGERLKHLLVQLKDLKNLKLTQAFTKTFLLAAWIMTPLIFIGVLTDRKKIQSK